MVNGGMIRAKTNGSRFVRFNNCGTTGQNNDWTTISPSPTPIYKTTVVNQPVTMATSTFDDELNWSDFDQRLRKLDSIQSVTFTIVILMLVAFLGCLAILCYKQRNGDFDTLIGYRF